MSYPQIHQQRELMESFGDATGSSPISLNLQANKVGFKVWQEDAYLEGDMDTTFTSLEGKLRLPRVRTVC